MLGPFLETAVLSVFGARGNFLAVSLINVVVTVIMARTAKETLPVADRKSINLIDCSPLSFFKMLNTGSANVRLMFVLLLQSFGGEKNDEFCIKKEECCIQNEELCIKSEEFCIKMMNFAELRINQDINMLNLKDNLGVGTQSFLTTCDFQGF